MKYDYDRRTAHFKEPLSEALKIIEKLTNGLEDDHYDSVNIINNVRAWSRKKGPQEALDRLELDAQQMAQRTYKESFDAVRDLAHAINVPGSERMTHVKDAWEDLRKSVDALAKMSRAPRGSAPGEQPVQYVWEIGMAIDKVKRQLASLQIEILR